MNQFLVVLALTVIIHLISTLAYAVRLSGVRTRRLLTAFSLYNIIFLLASVSNNIQIPLLTSIVEREINAGAALAGGIMPAEHLLCQEAYRRQLLLLAEESRFVMIAAALGTLAGALLIPFSVRVFIKAIGYFEETGSTLRTFVGLVKSLSRLPRRSRPLRPGLCSSLRRLAGGKLSIPKDFLLMNIAVTCFYTTGMLSALYAGALYPDFRTTATALSMIVNGFATVLGAVVVEPAVSAITDEALDGSRGEADVEQMTFYLALTRLAGTVAAQAAFLPCAYFIRFVVGILA
ncbi:MAG TPA: DUF2837 family protein [Bacillota bacterium]|nr:DUF2837 family protein [Bacillota bacterium]